MGEHVRGQGVDGGHVPAAGDWRTRMALRGGPVTNAVARAGWAVFGVLLAVAMVVVSLLYAMNPGEEGADNGFAGNFIGAFILFVIPGAIVGGLFGLGAQFAARSWLRTPTRSERRAAREAEAHTAHFAAHGLPPSGRWAHSFESCAKAVTAFHAVVETLPKGAGRDWLADIGKTLDSELSEALRLARLGESLEPDDTATLTDTASKVADSLRAAQQSFEATTDRAGEIALDLRDDSDFVRVRAQLDMLSEQAPRLREEGIS